MGTAKYAAVFSRMKMPNKLKGGRIEKIGMNECDCSISDSVFFDIGFTLGTDFAIIFDCYMFSE